MLARTPAATLEQIGIARLYLRERDGVFCLVDADDFAWLSAWRWNVGWHASTPWKRYAKRNVGVARSTVYLAREVMIRAEPHDEDFYSLRVADHVNGNSLDNRRANLRWATDSENRRNRVPRARVPALAAAGVAQLMKDALAAAGVAQLEDIPF